MAPGIGTEDTYSFIRRRGRQLHGAEVATGVVLGLSPDTQSSVHMIEATHIGSPRPSNSGSICTSDNFALPISHRSGVATAYSAFVFIGGQQQGMKTVSICSTARRRTP
jgi:hypothetical protein